MQQLLAARGDSPPLRDVWLSHEDMQLMAVATIRAVHRAHRLHGCTNAKAIITTTWALHHLR